MCTYSVDLQNVKNGEIALRNHLPLHIHCYMRSAHTVENWEPLHVLVGIEESVLKRTYIAKIACP